MVIAYCVIYHRINKMKLRGRNVGSNEQGPKDIEKPSIVEIKEEMGKVAPKISPKESPKVSPKESQKESPKESPKDRKKLVVQSGGWLWLLPIVSSIIELIK